MKRYLEQNPPLYNHTRGEAKIDANKAVSVARKFLEQYHSPVIFKSAYHNHNTWMISMEVGLVKEEIIEVSIDSRTGKILGYNH
jgi:hypothetical protein